MVDAKHPCGLIEEIPGYVWDRPITVTAASERKPEKEVPVKRHDHSCDPMRYVVAYRDLRARTRVRWT
jgi:hypothetical protein